MIEINSLNLSISKLFPRPFQKYALRGRKDMVGAEIGTDKGNNANSLLKRSSIKQLYLIDPYLFYEGHDYPNQDRNALKIAKKQLRKYNNKITWVRKFAHDAVNEIPNNLDFVYIDGNHKYEYVKQDVEDYYKKLRIGGVLAGHDFTDNMDPNTYGVIKAVMEFVTKHKLRLYVFNWDWWVIKDK